jgi:hypothetical protein
MLLLRFLLIIFATAFFLVLFTFVWVISQSRGSKAIGLLALSAMTLRSPPYWLVVVATLAVAGWLCRRWAFSR